MEKSVYVYTAHCMKPLLKNDNVISKVCTELKDKAALQFPPRCVCISGLSTVWWTKKYQAQEAMTFVFITNPSTLSFSFSFTLIFF